MAACWNDGVSGCECRIYCRTAYHYVIAQPEGSPAPQAVSPSPHPQPQTDEPQRPGQIRPRRFIQEINTDARCPRTSPAPDPSPRRCPDAPGPDAPDPSPMQIPRPGPPHAPRTPGPPRSPDSPGKIPVNVQIQPRCPARPQSPDPNPGRQRSPAPPPPRPGERGVPRYLLTSAQLSSWKTNRWTSWLSDAPLTVLRASATQLLSGHEWHHHHVSRIRFSVGCPHTMVIRSKWQYSPCEMLVKGVSAEQIMALEASTCAFC